MSRVLFSAGPIPTKLDSVKYITNRFKGGLALKTAEYLAAKGHEVSLLVWEYSDFKTFLPTIGVKDVNDYYEKILAESYDAYILGAAVANLGPVKPFEGKFPSHNYQVGEKFSLDFAIMPRAINAIKVRYPHATLVGYKLLDGPDDELISAAQQLLFESKANLIFANNPAWAKERKIAISPDGAAFSVNFNEHAELIHRLLTSSFYKTVLKEQKTPPLDPEEAFIIESYPRHIEAGMTFGTFAVRKGPGFLTTTRGKRTGDKDVAYVKGVDHVARVVYANQKATLNAPLLHSLLDKNPQIKYLIHGHKLIGDKVQAEYQFPGTDGDLRNGAATTKRQFLIQLPYHGYIAGFADFSLCKSFIEEHAHVG